MKLSINSIKSMEISNKTKSLNISFSIMMLSVQEIKLPFIKITSSSRTLEKKKGRIS